MYVLEFYCPMLADEMENIALLYYDFDEKKIVEFVEPLAIDKLDKSIKIELKKVNGIIIPMRDKV